MTDGDIQDTWQCQRCGESFEMPRGKRPLVCPNPNCHRKGPFKALAGPWVYFDGEKFVPGRLGEALKEKRRFITHEDSRVVYAYDRGVYRPNGQTVIEAMVRDALGPELCKINHVAEVLKHIEQTTYKPAAAFEAPINLVCVRNGLIDIDTGEFREHTPDVVFLAQLPVDYAPGADCPVIKKFLGEILGKGYVKMVQEIVGDTLQRDYRYAEATMFLGEGDNGKSTLLNLIHAFLGEENVVDPTLQELIYDKFQKAALFGKLANIAADIPNTAIKHTGVFKMLTGQDRIRAQEKFKKPFDFHNHAKLMYSANELPPTSDRTRAFWRRWIILKFSNIFPRGDPRTDPRMLEKLTTPAELSGFLNWALEGMRRLNDNRGFSIGEDEMQVKREWMMRTDSLRAFVEQHASYDPGLMTTKAGFFDAYRAFCDDNELEPVDIRRVGSILPTLLPKIISERRRKGFAELTRVWVGVKLLPPYNGMTLLQLKSIINLPNKITDLDDFNNQKRLEQCPISQHEKVTLVLSIIAVLEDEHGGAAPIAEIKKRAEAAGVPPGFVDVFISEEERRGHLYEPKEGHVSRSVK